jgi:23S rRNA C2498 (ribose-2'-O)-methylase RlmM
MDYNDMNIFRCKLSMVLEYIETHQKLENIEKHLKSPKINTKWKTKFILEKLFSEQKETQNNDY